MPGGHSEDEGDLLTITSSGARLSGRWRLSSHQDLALMKALLTDERVQTCGVTNSVC